MAKVRLSATVLSHLFGSGLWQNGEGMPEHGYGEEGDQFVATVDAAKRRADDSIVVDLDPQGLSLVWELADFMACAASDDAGFDDPSALGDLNAARALMRQIEKLQSPSVTAPG